MINGIQRTEIKTFAVLGTSGILHTVRCPYYIPNNNMTQYCVRDIRLEDDKVFCGKGSNRKRGYYLRGALRCLLCAYRHGYVVSMQRNKQPE
jgi:hypothetical protein